MRIIEVRQSVFASNDADAEQLRTQLKEEGTFLLNVMSSPGVGFIIQTGDEKPVNTRVCGISEACLFSYIS